MDSSGLMDFNGLMGFNGPTSFKGVKGFHQADSRAGSSQVRRCASCRYTSGASVSRKER